MQDVTAEHAPGTGAGGVLSGAECGTLAQCIEVLRRVERPVVLLEGIRALPDAHRTAVSEVGRRLAEALPQAIFRSGNAEGSDTAFAEGVTAVDPHRMQYVVTTPGMGRRRRHPAAPVIALTELPEAAWPALDAATMAATPNSKGLIRALRVYGPRSRLAAKAVYLLRDTLKVMGAPSIGLAPATFGLFYANPDDADRGGTAHTIRVCRQRGVEIWMQEVWL